MMVILQISGNLKRFLIYDKKIDKYGLIYYIKWKYYNKETQEPKKSLKGYKRVLLKFYK